MFLRRVSLDPQDRKVLPVNLANPADPVNPGHLANLEYREGLENLGDPVSLVVRECPAHPADLGDPASPVSAGRPGHASRHPPLATSHACRHPSGWTSGCTWSGGRGRRRVCQDTPRKGQR